MTRHFADRLMQRVRQVGPLCVGIDPHPHMFPELFGSPSAGAIAVWADGIIEAAAPHVACIKPQMAFFEIWGSPGIAALEHVCKTAREAGLIVILDGKRGDIGSTAAGYARAYLGEQAAVPVDALTINPFMGLETLDPFIDQAKANGRGAVVLTRTSNPGAADIEEQIVDGKPIFLSLAESLSERSAELMGTETDWSGLMMVVGATAPSEARMVREAAPKNLFLIPGYGAQGAGADEALAGFVPGKDGVLEGGVVSASRSVNFPAEAQSATTAETWQAAIREAVLRAQDDLIKASLRKHNQG